MYWREYRTQFHIAGSYGLSEATVCRTINKVEDALVRPGEFRLPGKKVLQPSGTIIHVVLVDVSEQPIERPKKAKTTLQRQKKRHTQKAQVIIHQKTMQIIATAFANSNTHDFRMFKESKSVMT